MHKITEFAPTIMKRGVPFLKARETDAQISKEEDEKIN